ncbi:uncharacterized protein LOC111612367 [Centruroides sculpturatus]|uniref:uncharacterized protein LOC111612367 n=1 Tax=Centruroides sculpturatus TaxID=218467 RepID=UPI000C6EBFF3|nr:uncharacterized protein LOC111612367 [Centruroides sculpturatus]
MKFRHFSVKIPVLFILFIFLVNYNSRAKIITTQELIEKGNFTNHLKNSNPVSKVIKNIMLRIKRDNRTENTKSRNYKNPTIVIKDSGIMKLKREDQVMIFYITITNVGTDTLKLRVNGEQCCQKITAEETDCETMQLIGGEIGELKHGDTRSLTLMYPNLYLHDRKGSCKVFISSNNDKMEYNINFETLLPKKHQPIPPLLSDYLANKEIKECSSVDENPLNDCLPVICLIKYSGKRNYFNHTTRRCQKVTECVSETERNLPDIVYIPESNTCRNLSSKLKKAI